MRLVGIQRLAASHALATPPSAVTVAQSVDIAALGGLPRYQKALASVLLVVAFGGLMLRGSADRVDRSLEALYERPYSALPYGIMAYVVALTVGLFGISQLSRVGVANTLLGRLTALVVVGGLVALTAFGFLVVGTLATEVRGPRRPTSGLLLGAALSGLGWLVLPATGGLAVWMLVAAFGLGGAVRRWFHAERTVETERAG